MDSKADKTIRAISLLSYPASDKDKLYLISCKESQQATLIR